MIDAVYIQILGDSNDSNNKPEQEQIGFEVLEIQSRTSIRAWISADTTFDEFDSLELPPGLQHLILAGAARIEGCVGAGKYPYEVFTLKIRYN